MLPDAVLFITRLAPDIHQHLIGLLADPPLPQMVTGHAPLYPGVTASRIQVVGIVKQTTNLLEGPGIVRAPSRRLRVLFSLLWSRLVFFLAWAPIFPLQPHDNIPPVSPRQVCRTGV